MWPFKRETRAEVTGPVSSNDPFIGAFLAARASTAADITEASAHAVAYRCIAIIAENLAQVPLKLYKYTPDGGSVEADDHPLYKVLQGEYAPGVGAYEARELQAANLLQTGDSFHKIERNGNFQVVGLTHMDPLMTTVERTRSGSLIYTWTDPNGTVHKLSASEVLHVRHKSLDGIRGRSPMAIASAAFALALAQQNQAIAQAENSFRPAGALVFPNNIGNDEKKAGVAQKFKNRFVGAMKSGEVMILDGGVKFESFSANSRDSEFVESRKLSNLDVCRVFGVPPSAAGITDNATYSNIGEESRALVTRCIAPWANRVEDAMNIALLSPESRKTFYIAHDLGGMLRGDQKTRFEAYKVGREGGWLNVDEIREFENMSKVKGGDTYLQPMNHVQLGSDMQRMKEAA